MTATWYLPPAGCGRWAHKVTKGLPENLAGETFEVLVWYWPNDVCHCGYTRSQLYYCLSFILVPCSVVSLCNSFGNAVATARATDSELYGYLTTWEGTRIIARVTGWHRYHYSDVIMSARAYHITSLTIVYSTVYSGADQRKHQSSASLIFVRGIHRWPVNSPHKGPVTQKMFPFDDVILATCIIRFRYPFHKWFSNMQCGLNPIFGNYMANN